MNVISKPALMAFWAVHPDAQEPLTAWYRHVRKAEYANFAEVRADFGSVDWVGGYIVFNISGNKYRLIVTARFQSRTFWIKHVLTHREYDDWRP